jgi:hypothetical protein
MAAATMAVMKATMKAAPGALPEVLLDALRSYVLVQPRTSPLVWSPLCASARPGLSSQVNWQGAGVIGSTRAYFHEPRTAGSTSTSTSTSTSSNMQQAAGSRQVAAPFRGPRRATRCHAHHEVPRCTAVNDNQAVGGWSAAGPVSRITGPWSSPPHSTPPWSKRPNAVVKSKKCHGLCHPSEPVSTAVRV